ncbi:hypothetical protein MMC25_005189 [Agyrium rufum]|nr:hypothetical protein [Agyrium rufum]
MPPARILIYLLRRDLRLADNPIFHEICKSCQQSQSPYTYLLPLYVFPAQQLEVSGFLSPGESRSPYPEARSQAGGFWRCGPHRARFLTESVWDLKKSLEGLNSGLVIRVGMLGQVVKELLDAFAAKSAEGEIVSLWMTDEEGVEEKREEREVRRAVESKGKDFKLWTDEKYFVDDRDIPFQNPRELPDVFTNYRKQVEPLRDAPRRVLKTPTKLPPFPPMEVPSIGPFSVPDNFDDMMKALLKPLEEKPLLSRPMQWPSNAKSAHPFHGGEATGHLRIKHLIASGNMTTYKDTRNGMLGEDFSTKLSAWFALGCVTARQVHDYLVAFEDGTSDLGKGAPGYGKGENKGTAAVRFELLWRDYMRLCTKKFGPRLFRESGFRHDDSMKWKYAEKDKDVQRQVERFLAGETGTGLIDASMRELYLTGYTSNRARQNVASFLAKHLGIDWRIGAEWYESLLCDYDLSSNWGNWQYTAGVGNDPRGEARVFNPVKQAFDYDPKADYVKNWVDELREVDEAQYAFQAWKLPEDEKARLKLKDLEWVESPLKKIEFRVGKHSANGGKGRGGKRGGGRGGGGRGGGGGGGYNGRGRGQKTRGQGRMGTMDKAQEGFDMS